MADIFKGWLKPDFIREIKRLENVIDELKSEKDNVQKLKNERGAGRKPKLTRELHTDIVNRINGGENYRYIAKRLKISVGLVGKAKNMNDDEIEKLSYEFEPVHIVFEKQINIDDYAEKCAWCGTPNYEAIGDWEWFACTECEFINYQQTDGESEE